MSLADRLLSLASAIGLDIKTLQGRLTAIETGTGSIGATICVVNSAAHLIETQKIMVQIALAKATL